MSIYVTTVGELAKKRGVPAGDFLKTLNEKGFEVKSGTKKLTQEDLDKVISLLDGVSELPKKKEEVVERMLVNPNVLMINKNDRDIKVILIDATMNEDGSVNIEVIQTETTRSIGDALLEFRKLMGMKMGVR